MTEAIKMSQALKPCPNPWCRDNTPKLSQRGGHLYFVMCTGCGIKCEYEHTEAEAITAWNTRHESQLPLLEALEEARDAINVTRHLVAEASLDGRVTEVVYLNNGPLSNTERKIDTILASIRGEAS